ncbi:MAG: EAL domain-containing protein [Candidatus Sumerlaeia bacterium]|nr:EAL domain-containing protein [Candidatus Sumerlaeia bacterium]
MSSEITALLIGAESGRRPEVASLLRAVEQPRVLVEEASGAADVAVRAQVFLFDLIVVCAGDLSRADLAEALRAHPEPAPPAILIGELEADDPDGHESLPHVVAIVSAGHLTARLLQQSLQNALRSGRLASSARVELPDGLRETGRRQVIELLDGGAEGMVVTRADGTVVFANEAASRLLTGRSTGLAGTVFGYSVRAGETRDVIVPAGPEGRIRWIELRASRCGMEGGEALLLTLHDVTVSRERDAQVTRLAEVVNQTDQSVVITDLDGRIVYVNPGFERATGFGMSEVAGRNPRLLKGRTGVGTDFRQMWETLRSGQVWEGRFYNRRKDGSEFIENATVFPIRDVHGRVINYAAVKSDITEEVRVIDALRRSEERYALAARAVHDGLWDWNLETDEFYVSPRWKEMLGCQDMDLAPRIDEWYSRVHPDDLPNLQSGLTAHLLGDTTHFQCEHRVRHHEGSFRWVFARGLAWRDETGRPQRIAGSMTDITERKVSEEQLLHQAWHDGLTNLINRATFIDRLRQRLTRARWRNNWQFAVLFVDLDRFKAVNDSLGHLAGDDMLIELARRMRDVVSESDIIGRIGGDEFGILVEDFANSDEALLLARRILEVFDRPFDIQGRQFHISASVGIAFAESRYQDAEHLLRDADTAMYRAKKKGRGKCLVFERPMLDETLKVVEMEIDLHNAIEHDQLRAYYQPIVSVATGRIVGFEALVRWHHPAFGLISPGEFIPIAEESGLIMAIDLWVLREAGRQVARWQEHFTDAIVPEYFLSTNLSARHFETDAFPQIAAALADIPLPAGQVKLEITESLLLDQTESVLPLLQELHALGAQISLDDFGTGYSSLSYLHQFPVNTLKIDRSFVKEMLDNERSGSIVRVILVLAHNLGIPVVAEGVETPEHLEVLRGFECDYAQGYLFSRPVPPEVIEGLLAEKKVW